MPPKNSRYATRNAASRTRDVEKSFEEAKRLTVRGNSQNSEQKYTDYYSENYKNLFNCCPTHRLENHHELFKIRFFRTIHNKKPINNSEYTTATTSYKL